MLHSSVDERGLADRLTRMNQDNLRVPLAWVATTETQPNTNFGDGLSAVMVSALADIPVERANFDQPSERIVAVGTIGHNLINGVVHFWGTGVDASRNPLGQTGPYRHPANTEIHVHALRGPESAATLRSAGISAPEIYGDPVILLPRLWPLADVEKTAELGVIVHISELEAQTPAAAVKDLYARYHIPESERGSIRIINTFCAPTPEAMQAKVREIVSCKRIASTSLHGLVIAEAYGVPCVWFATYGEGAGTMLRLNDLHTKVDHRIRDFYRGVRIDTLSAYCQDRKLPTDWQALQNYIDASATPLTGYDPLPLIEAFPLPRRADAAEARWKLRDDLFAPVHF
jgi:hypothetical protein